jgi:hypothetical protein
MLLTRPHLPCLLQAAPFFDKPVLAPLSLQQPRWLP